MWSRCQNGRYGNHKGGQNAKMAGMMEKTWQARGHNGMQLPSHFFTFNKIFLLDVHCPIFQDGRETNIRVRLAAGKYCIIPSTFMTEQEGDFILRQVAQIKRRHLCCFKKYNVTCQINRKYHVQYNELNKLVREKIYRNGQRNFVPRITSI